MITLSESTTPEVLTVEVGSTVVVSDSGTQIVETAAPDTNIITEALTTEIVTTDSGTTVLTTSDVIEIITEAAQGPVGPLGPPGAAGAVNYVAAVAINGHEALTLNSLGQVIPADAATSTHRTVVGIALNASVIGGNVQVISFGAIEHIGWTFTPNAHVYLGLAGALTQTVPEAAVFSKVLGIAKSATRLAVDFQPAIFK